ncbi:MAG: hypothetical protein AAF430_14500 [Myxococcota bacterium]
MERTLRHALLLVGLTSLLACAGVKPIDLATEDPSSLPEDAAILVLEIDTEVRIGTLEISGVAATNHVVAKDLKEGKHLLFVSLRPGQYSWRMLKRYLGGTEYHWRLRREHDRMGFRVERGLLNYPGVLRVRRARYDRWLEIRNLNHAAQTRARLAREFPELLEKFPIRYTGEDRDEFLERYEAALEMQVERNMP